MNHLNLKRDKLRAIMVCVNYADLLEHTLPYNRHHFSDVMIVTTPADKETIKIALRNKCLLTLTESFYDNGADFNKWKAVEEGLDNFGRVGWLCNMDADVLWPKVLPDFDLHQGCIYGPRRRMMEQVKLPLPFEEIWNRYPLHPQSREIAGFSQIFHADDPAVAVLPWFEQNWRHAGGGDSMFQYRWKAEHRQRVPFEVLHLGSAGRNWCGRSTNLVDGTTPEKSQQNFQKTRAYIAGRRAFKAAGQDPFTGERFSEQKDN